MELVAGIIVALGGLLVGIHRLVKFLLDYVATMQDKHEVFLREERHENQTFIGNHMSKNTATLANLVDATSGLSTSVAQLHEDNMATAALLKKADRLTIRKVEEQNGGVQA